MARFFGASSPKTICTTVEKTRTAVTDRLSRAAYDMDGSSSSASPTPTSGSET
jgi:hypothetical protein